MTKIEKNHMRITVQMVSGRKITLDFDPEETIKSLKKEITYYALISSGLF